MATFLDSDGKSHDFTPKQNLLLNYHTITFILGTHFHCPPHMWDDMPPDRVYLDYAFVLGLKREEEKAMNKAERNAKRYNAGGNANKGRPIRTTSDASNLEDFFDRENVKLRDE